MPDQEAITFDVDPRSVMAAIKQMNTAVESFEKGGVGANERVGKAAERMADLLLKVNDRSRNSLERLTQSIEKQAAAYGKSGVDRLVAERDRIIKRLGDEQAMVERVTAAYAKMINVEQLAANGGSAGGTGFNARYAFFGLKDIMEGRTKFAIAEAANELTRLQGTALMVGGSVAGVAALGYAAYEVAKGLREIREEPEKIATAFAQMEEPLRARGDELRATNAHLEETIAKLRNQPENGLRSALYDARVEADKLAESLTKDLEALSKLLKENDVSTWHQLLGAAGTSDIRKVVDTLLSAQNAVMADFSKRMGQTKNPKDVANLQADAERRLKNLYEAAQEQLKDRQEQAPGVAWFATALKSLGSGVPGIVLQDDAARQKMLQETSDTLKELLSQAQNQVAGTKLKSERDRLQGGGNANDLEAAMRAQRRALASLNDDKFAAIAAEQQEAINEAVDKYKEKAGPLVGLIKQVYDAKWVKEFNAEVERTNKEAADQAAHWQRLTLEAAKFRETASEKEMAEATKALEERSKAVAALAREYSKLNATGEKQALAHQKRMVGLTGSDDALDTLAQQQALDYADILRRRQAALNDLSADPAKAVLERANAEKQAANEVGELRYQWEEKVAELQHKEFEDLKRESTGLWNTLLTKPSDFPKQLGGTIHSAILKPITDGLGNMTAKVLDPIIHGSDGQGGIAGIFKGIFGGGKQDPIKAATDLNTTATMQNSAAVAALTAVFAGMMGVATPAVAMPTGLPGGISIPAISAPAIPGVGAGSGGFSLPAIFGAAGAPGGTPGFTGPVNLGGLTQGGGNGGSPLAAIIRGSGGTSGNGGVAGLFSKQTLANLRGMVWNQKAWDAFPSTTGGDLAGGALAIGTSPAATAAGMMLGTSGLMGSHRGTWGGIAMGTAGGALVGAGIGMQVGGPAGALLGAGIGAVAGFGIGLGEKLFGVESPENQAKRLAKQVYSVNIDNSMAKQIVAIAQQKYAGEVSVAVRDPDVRKMLMLYSEATGQHMPLSATTPYGASLVEQNSKLYQQAVYANGGQAYAYQSGLSVLGAPAGGANMLPLPGQMTLQVNVQGQGAAQFVAGQVVTPEYVQAQWSNAGAASNGRTLNSAMMQQPGLIVA